jgi:peptidase E
MINILFDCPNLDDFKEELREYFSEDSRVAVVAFSFYDDYVYDAASWEKVYGRGLGNCYLETVDALSAFGVSKDNITFINYFTDTHESARDKIKNANVVYFTGGLPDRMMDRIKEFNLLDTLREFDGIAVGYSAGAVIQLAEYHLYPDGDYKDFEYYEGLDYLNSLYLEVHYEFKPEQNESIRRVLAERNLPVYVTHTRRGGVVVDNGRIKIIGKVDVYE